MENKYFTPEIEDIRVGYEMYAPLLDESGKETGQLVKIIIDSPNWANEICDISVNYDVLKDYKLGDVWKVSYLTKEQIEAEGWEYINTIRYWNAPSKIKGLCFRKNNHLLSFNPYNNNISIIPVDPSKEQEYWEQVRYVGKCPSINEFRTILKLLEI